MIIDLWGGPVPEDRDMPVWTMYKYIPSLGEDLLCDYAWTSKDECFDHFWTKTEVNNVKFVTMPLSEYIKLHLAMIRGMNPMWDKARAKTLGR